MTLRVNPKKIVLGTAQFGSNYGIMNQNGKLSKKEVHSILEKAWKLGVRSFDTAPGYNSETLIGEFVNAHGIHDEIIILTKVPGLSSKNIRDEVLHSITNSVKSLNCDISVLFLHNPDDVSLIIDHSYIFEDLKINFNLKDVGASIYDPNSVFKANTCNLSLALQFPMNFVDRRFENIKMNVGKRYARSVFLQGILSSQERLPYHAPVALKSLHSRYHRFCTKLGFNSYSLALSFCLFNSCVDYVLIGVDNINQLTKIFKTKLIQKEKWNDISFSLNENEKKVLDPRNWTKE